MIALALFLSVVLFIGSNAFNPGFRSTSVRASLSMSLEPISPRESAAKSVAMGAGAFTAAAALLASPRAARAGLFESAEQSTVNEIGVLQRPIFDLSEQLKPNMVPNSVGVYSSTQILKGGKDDSDVVLSYMITYINPLQVKMAKVAPTLKLPKEEDQKRIEILGDLMKGHMLELRAAIKSMDAKEQAKEVDEVRETLAEFLKLAGTKYEVAPFKPIRPLTDKELFGPLGCEFWGKKRIPGSNACAPIEE